MLTLLPHERNLTKSIYLLPIPRRKVHGKSQGARKKPMEHVWLYFYSSISIAKRKKHRNPLEEFVVNWATLTSRIAEQ